MSDVIDCYTHHKKQNFTIIQNDLIRSKELSCKAFKLLCIGLSHSGKWKFQKEQIIRDCFKEGRHTVNEAMKELKKNGYLHTVAKQKPNGQMDGHYWYWFAEKTSDEEFKKILRELGFPAFGKPDIRKTRSSENLDDLRRPTSKNTNDRKNKKKGGDPQPPPSFAPKALRLSHFFFQQIKQNDPKAKSPNFEKWAVELNRMHKIDGRSWEEIQELIEFAQEDEFWRCNCLSPAKLRKNATRLVMAKAQKKKKSQSPQEEKADRFTDNQRYARQRWGDKSHKIIQLGKKSVKVHVHGEEHLIGYHEHGFIQQVESAIRKAGDLP